MDVNIEWLVVGLPVRPVFSGFQVEGDVQEVSLHEVGLGSDVKVQLLEKRDDPLFRAVDGRT